MLQKQQNWQTEPGLIKKTLRFIDKLLCLTNKNLLSQRFIRVSLLSALIVWTLWLTLIGPSKAFSIMSANWEAALTMVFGSMVAGGTSMGGGAVVFPVFTKVLHVPPHKAKVFSLAIQSIGMTAASLTIVAMGTKVEWRFIRWASLGGIPGIIIGSVLLAFFLPPTVVKFSFTMMVTSFAVILLVLNRTGRKRNLAIPYWGKREQIISLAVGLFGGIISGLVGSGMDIFAFSVLVVLFGLSEKISTPTSVILMAINAVVGFVLHRYFLGDFVQPVLSYWLAAVPVVVIGAPAGAIIFSLFKRKTVVKILMGLILSELVSSILLIPISTTVMYSSLFVFALFSSIYYWMYQSNTYTRRRATIRFTRI